MWGRQKKKEIWRGGGAQYFFTALYESWNMSRIINIKFDSVDDALYEIMIFTAFRWSCHLLQIPHTLDVSVHKIIIEVKFNTSVLLKLPFPLPSNDPFTHSIRQKEIITSAWLMLGPGEGQSHFPIVDRFEMILLSGCINRTCLTLMQHSGSSNQWRELYIVFMSYYSYSYQIKKRDLDWSCFYMF